MWHCDNCKQYFPENYIVEQTEYVLHDEVDTDRYEKVTIGRCPYCGSIEIDKGEQNGE